MNLYRGFVIGVVVASAAAIGLGVWQSWPTDTGASGSMGMSRPAVAAPSVGLSPPDRATDVPPDRPVSVTASTGRLAALAVTAGDGTVLPGALGPNGSRWTATRPLAYGTSYRYAGTAIGTDGRPWPVTGSFSTVAPARTLHAKINIGDGQAVGVAAPIIVQFNGHVADKAAAERALTVQTSVPTAGSWAWLPDDNGGSRAHWRPKDFWRPGTKVAVTVHQFGVDDGDGAWGDTDLTSHFTIGRAEIVKADVNSHQLVVLVDGAPVMTLPASYGLGSDPNRNTTNGIHVVMSKSLTVLMSNPAYGYNNVPEYWAVRFDNYGEFIHANPETTGVQGSENVTHGCVNLSTTDAQRYFDQAIFGDPVEVTGSPTPFTPADGDISDWTVPWDHWSAMSALPTPVPPAPHPAPGASPVAPAGPPQTRAAG